MDYSKKYHWALTGFIILLILNIGTLATIWFSPGPPYFRMQTLSSLSAERGSVEVRSRAGGSGLRIQAGNFMAEELDLSADQAEQFEKLRREHLKKIRPLIEKIIQQRRKYFTTLEQGDSLPTPEEMDSIAHRIGQAHAKSEKANYQHFTKVRNLLDEDQKEQFKKFLRIMMQRTTIAVPAMPAEPSFHLKGETAWPPRK